LRKLSSPNDAEISLGTQMVPPHATIPMAAAASVPLVLLKRIVEKSAAMNLHGKDGSKSAGSRRTCMERLAAGCPAFTVAGPSRFQPGGVQQRWPIASARGPTQMIAASGSSAMASRRRNATVFVFGLIACLA
jgi:hypothetical protein